MDPLSEVLSLLKLNSFMAGGFDLAGEWSIQFARHEGIKCYAVVSGACWLVVEGVADAVRLATGDCFLLPRGLPFRLASNIDLPSVDAHTVLRNPLNGGIMTWNGGGEVFGVGGYFHFTGSHADILLAELPPVVHIRSESDKAEMRWSLDRMRQELREQRPGASLVAQQLATTMLVQALRLHLTPSLAQGISGKAGWLSALVDEQMKGAITAMHTDPAYRWTLDELAELSRMSRSIFALKFKAKVGTTPMEYLTRWRMLLAGNRLTTSDDPIATIGLSLGYESESAFSKAFRRTMMCSPSQYRRVETPERSLYSNSNSKSSRQLELIGA